MTNEQQISLPVTIKELGIIMKLRKLPFGSIEIIKEHGSIERIIVRQTERVSEKFTLSEVLENEDVVKILESANLILKIQ